jgi:hypothetical protein
VGDDTKLVLYFECKGKGLYPQQDELKHHLRRPWRRDRRLGGGGDQPLPDNGRISGRRVSAIRCLVPPRKPQKPVDAEPNDDIPF